jgi:hypothetical protein
MTTLLAEFKTKTLVEQYALLIGISFLLAGVGGFVPFVTTAPSLDSPQLIVGTSYGYLLGLFPVNIIHNIFHLSLSLAGFLAYRNPSSALLFSRFLTIVLGALAIMGLIPALQTLGGYVPVFGHAIWLHGIEAVIALYLGFIRPH